MPPWLADSAVISTFITASGGVLGILITSLVNRKDKQTRDRFDSILNSLDGFDRKMKTIGRTTSDIKAISELTRDGTKKMQRYRLFHDLTMEISRGETTIEHFRELSILFESYQSLGGNGEIEALFEKYKQLPLPIEEEKKQ